MSIRKKTENRLTLYRECAICGQHIVTTADTPWMRMMPWNGKKQATCYFCSTSCFQASYKHIGWYDGKAEERRQTKSRRVSREKQAEWNKRYYANHREEMRERRKKYYWNHHEEELKNSAYQKRKRKLLNPNNGDRKANG